MVVWDGVFIRTATAATHGFFRRPFDLWKANKKPRKVKKREKEHTSNMEG